MDAIGRFLALEAIAAYQRFVSPYKGFRCAYAYHTGCASCSRLGYRAIRWRGLLDGLTLLFQRFDRCRNVYTRFRKPRPSHTRLAHRQRGFCDALACIPCDAGCAAAPCDATPCDAVSLPDAANCCTSGCPSPCDCWPWEREKPKREQQKAT